MACTGGLLCKLSVSQTICNCVPASNCVQSNMLCPSWTSLRMLSQLLYPLHCFHPHKLQYSISPSFAYLLSPHHIVSSWNKRTYSSWDLSTPPSSLSRILVDFQSSLWKMLNFNTCRSSTNTTCKPLHRLLVWETLQNFDLWKALSCMQKKISLPWLGCNFAVTCSNFNMGRIRGGVSFFTAWGKTGSAVLLAEKHLRHQPWFQARSPIFSEVLPKMDVILPEIGADGDGASPLLVEVVGPHPA